MDDITIQMKKNIFGEFTGKIVRIELYCPKDKIVNAQQIDNIYIGRVAGYDYNFIKLRPYMLIQNNNLVTGEDIYKMPQNSPALVINTRKINSLEEVVNNDTIIKQ